MIDFKLFEHFDFIQTPSLIQHAYLASGGYDYTAGLYSDQLLQFNKQSNKFDAVGRIEQRRMSHSMTLVNLSDYTCKQP